MFDKVAAVIVGRGPTQHMMQEYITRLSAHHNVWVWAQTDMEVSSATHHFEMHAPRHHRPVRTDITTYIHPQADKTGYWDQHYPLEDIRREVGRGYAPFGSTLSYMIALALYFGVDAMALPGCDLIYEREFRREKERADAQFWLGIAVERGVQLYIPEHSLLLKHEEYK